MGNDNKTCLSVFIYIINTFLIVKGVLWILGFASLFLFPLAFLSSISQDDGNSRKRRAIEIPIGLLFWSILAFGIGSLVFAIVGIIGAAKKNRPTLLTAAILIFLLFAAEAGVWIVHIILDDQIGSLQYIGGIFWFGISSAVLTLLSFSLSLALYCQIDKYDDY